MILHRRKVRHEPAMKGLLTAILLLLWGCGGNEPKYDWVLHLDPRLADGRSSLAGLTGDGGDAALFRFAENDPSYKAWRLDQGAFQIILTDMGLLLVPDEPTDETFKEYAFTHDETFQAERFNVVDVKFASKQCGYTLLKWRCSDRPEVDHSIRKDFANDTREKALTYSMVFDPNWHGSIEDLCIVMHVEGKDEFLLQEVGFHWKAFEMGFEPLEEGGEDGGLVSIRQDARRAWPARAGVPLFTALTVPERGCFKSSVSVLPYGGRDDAFSFFVELREGGEAWQCLAEKAVAPMDGWVPLDADLTPWEGKQIELRLLSRSEGGSLDAAHRAVLCWGEPVILGRFGGGKRPNVLLITLDTTRADHIGDEKETPHLAALGREGVEFENAWSTCNSTTPSHASILTGLQICEHGAVTNRHSLTPAVTTLAEYFRHAGYETVAAVSVGHIQAGVGFGQGFDRFFQAREGAHLNGQLTVDPVLVQLDEWGIEGERPFFLWLHLFDPHIPYGPPAKYQQVYDTRPGALVPPRSSNPPSIPQFDAGTPAHLAWLKEITNRDYAAYLYDAGISYTDLLTEEVLARLKERMLFENTAVVITADHGECLGEHAVWYNHAGLYRESLHVPMIVKVPGGPEGLISDALVSTADIAPTLVNLCRLGPALSMGGKDLLAQARENVPSTRVVLFEHDGLHQIGLRDNHFHFITTLTDYFNLGYRVDVDDEGRRVPFYIPVAQGTNFLYSLDEDPGLTRNVALERPEIVQKYLEFLDRWRKNLSTNDSTERSVTGEEEERLRALGY